MGNCMAKKKQREVTLAMLGIDNAGKTSVLKCLTASPLNDITPTVGFSREIINHDKFQVTCYDLGGGPRIRNIWKNYLAEVYGIIYIIDASDHPRLEESGQLLTGLIEHPRVRGKPILLLLNKQDKDQAIDEVDITEMLNLQTLVNYHKCPCRVDSCCANKGTGKKADPAIRSGFAWLLSWIGNNWDKLNQRVGSDVMAQDKEMAEEKRQREERVRRARAEREKEEQTGEVKNDNEMVNGALVNGHASSADTMTSKLPPLNDKRLTAGAAEAMKSLTLPSPTAYSSDSVRSNDWTSNNSRPVTNLTETFGLSDLSQSQLPAVSPGVERRLPAIVPPTNVQARDTIDKIQTEHVIEPPVETREAPLLMKNGFDEKVAVDLASVEKTAIAKRKRKRRRLRRLNKTAPSASSETDATSSSGSLHGREVIDLATLQSSEPRPQTPNILPSKQQANAVLSEELPDATVFGKQSAQQVMDDSAVPHFSTEQYTHQPNAEESEQISVNHPTGISATSFRDASQSDLPACSEADKIDDDGIVTYSAVQNPNLPLAPAGPVEHVTNNTDSEVVQAAGTK